MLAVTEQPRRQSDLSPHGGELLPQLTQQLTQPPDPRHLVFSRRPAAQAICFQMADRIAVDDFWQNHSRAVEST